jgi:predicted permease
MIPDLRHTLRGLRRSPGYAATVIVTLALGIGANATMFGVVDRLMFRPPPFLRDPVSVHRAYLQDAPRGQVLTSTVFPYTRYLDLERETSSFSQVAAFSQNTWAVGTSDATREEPIAAVSAAFFEFFDAHPALGRFFDPSEDVVPRGAAVAVLDYGFWQREFGGKNLIGQQLQIGTIAYTVIGVAPKRFVGVMTERPPVAFVPITTVAANDDPRRLGTYFTDYRWDFTSMLVRRRPGVSVKAATADLTQAFVKSRDAARLQMPEVASTTIAHPVAIAGPLRTAAGPGAPLESKTLLWVTGVAVIVLVIACANVTNLMLARILSRRREIAVRLALGVHRRRLVVQLLMESWILAIVGCVAGLIVAQWGGAALRALTLADGGGTDVITDWRTLGVAAACAITTGTMTAIAPALLALRGDLAETLKSGVRGGIHQRSRLRSTLLVLQCALSVALLVGTGLFVRSLNNARTLPLGYDADPVFIAYPNMRGASTDSASRARTYSSLVDAARAVPGVEAVTRIDSRPFATSSASLFVAGIDSVAKLGRFDIQVTTPDYFHVMHTRIIRGRAFTAEDRAGTPRVSVVSGAMARALWLGHEAIGQCIRIGSDTAPCTTVIGVAEDAVYENFTDDRGFVQYLPLEQVGANWGNKLLIRVRSRDSASIETVRRGLQRAMPAQGYVRVQPFAELLDAQRRSWALGATMFVMFGALALVIAAVGLYGVITYSVAQRTHELGVRLALGARRWDVVRLVVGQGVAFAIAGVGIGLSVALVSARWLQPLLFRQAAVDPTTYGAVSGIIVGVALIASVMPARRAMRADPNVALRTH